MKRSESEVDISLNHDVMASFSLHKRPYPEFGMVHAWVAQKHLKHNILGVFKMSQRFVPGAQFVLNDT
jgi:hypothetical protein